MRALSTSWISNSLTSGRQLLAELEMLRVDGIELEYRIDRGLFIQLQNALKVAKLPVLSVHNYCPFVPLPPGLIPGGDQFRLSHPDRELRRLAVAQTIYTLEHAHELEARAVVLHCGFIPMDRRMDRLRGLVDSQGVESEAVRSLVLEIQRRRAMESPVYLDALLFSLDQLIPTAQRYGIVLGLENRFHLHEMPQAEEFERIFAEFSGAPVGYWHDSGHAHAQEVLSVITAETLLSRFGRVLAGVHLHDARLLEDHLPPGDGEIDFKALFEHLQPHTIPIVELKPGTQRSAVQRGLTFIEAIHRNRFGGPSTGAIKRRPSADESTEASSRE